MQLSADGHCKDSYISCQLFLVILLGQHAKASEVYTCTHIVVVWLLHMQCTYFWIVWLLSRRGFKMGPC